MRKLLPLLLIALFSVFIVSCNSDDNNNNNNNNTDTVAEVYEIKNENFTLNNRGNLTIYKQFNNALYASDMVLIYRQEGETNGNPIWTLVPKSYYTTFGTVDYTYDFTINDVQIYLDTNITDTETLNSYMNNQTFRVVVIPATLGRSASNISTNSEYEDYNYVVRRYNINQQNVKQL